MEALGHSAPKGSSEVRVPDPCADCGAEMLVLDFGTGQDYTVCPDCGDEVAVTV